MPIYDWKCGKCGKKFEAIAPMSEDGGKVRCPKCGHRGAVKQLSAVSLPGKPSAPSCGHDHKGGGS